MGIFFSSCVKSDKSESDKEDEVVARNLGLKRCAQVSKDIKMFNDDMLLAGISHL